MEPLNTLQPAIVPQVPEMLWSTVGGKGVGAGGVTYEMGAARTNSPPLADAPPLTDKPVIDRLLQVLVPLFGLDAVPLTLAPPLKLTLPFVPTFPFVFCFVAAYVPKLESKLSVIVPVSVTDPQALEVAKTPY